MSGAARPMDPERLAELRRSVHPVTHPSFVELLADRDYQEQRADDLVARVAWLEARRLEARRLEDVEARMLELRAVGAERDRDAAAAGIAEARLGRDFLARLVGSAICRATCIAPGERVIEDNAAIAEHALTTAVESLRARAENAETEIGRLRARVRVEAEDVERAGVARAHVEAWLRAQGWAPTTESGWKGFSDGSTVSTQTWRPAPYNARGVSIEEWDRPEAVADNIRTMAYHLARPGLDILDEMAAMEVPTGGES